MYLHAQGVARGVHQAVLGRLTNQPIVDSARRPDYVIDGRSAEIARFADDYNGYAGVLGGQAGTDWPLPSITGAPNLEYLADGDVVALWPSGMVNVLYRKGSRHNTILATERCNSLCLMCSQPPRLDDDSYRIFQILRLLDLVDPACPELLISGGEPTLLGEGFFEIIAKAERSLPATALHVLTNGRLFQDRELTQRLGALQHHDLMLGIPLYSDIDEHHDYVVQAKGAYDETMLGYYHLAEAGIPIEIRVVLHTLTVPRLPALAEFIYRNLPFVSQVALMGLEPFGYANLNWDRLWIDPFDYQSQLEAAVSCLALRGMRVRIYNHQLCTLPRAVWPFSVQSISDWKNVYLPACEPCSVRSQCGGFFQSATKRHSKHVVPIL